MASAAPTTRPPRGRSSWTRPPVPAGRTARTAARSSSSRTERGPASSVVGGPSRQAPHRGPRDSRGGAEGDPGGCGVAVADVLDGDRLTRLLRQRDGGQIIGTRDRLAVDGDDDVT